MVDQSAPIWYFFETQLNEKGQPLNPNEVHAKYVRQVVTKESSESTGKGSSAGLLGLISVIARVSLQEHAATVM